MMNLRRQPQRRGAALAAGVALVGLTATACAGAGGSGGGGGGGGGNGGSTKGQTIHVLMVNNPQMIDLEHLTAGNFTKQTGIKVDFTTLPEDNLRDKASQEFSSKAAVRRGHPVGTSRSRSTPRTAGWPRWTATSAKDTGFDQSDILQADRQFADRLGRQGLRRAVLRRVVVPDVPQGRVRGQAPDHPGQPDWNQVAHPGSKADGAKPGMKGICLRGQTGWGEVLAPLTTVVNTFGGTWFHQELDGPGRRGPGLAAGPPTSTSTWSSSTARRTRRSPGSPSA